jgi:hypothetical protein
VLYYVANGHKTQRKHQILDKLCTQLVLQIVQITVVLNIAGNKFKQLEPNHRKQTNIGLHVVLYNQAIELKLCLDSKAQMTIGNNIDNM